MEMIRQQLFCQRDNHDSVPMTRKGLGKLKDILSKAGYNGLRNFPDEKTALEQLKGVFVKAGYEPKKHAAPSGMMMFKLSKKNTGRAITDFPYIKVQKRRSIQGFTVSLTISDNDNAYGNRYGTDVRVV